MEALDKLALEEWEDEKKLEDDAELCEPSEKELLDELEDGGAEAELLLETDRLDEELLPALEDDGGVEDREELGGGLLLERCEVELDETLPELDEKETLLDERLLEHRELDNDAPEELLLEHEEREEDEEEHEREDDELDDSEFDEERELTTED